MIINKLYDFKDTLSGYLTFFEYFLYFVVGALILFLINYFKKTILRIYKDYKKLSIKQNFFKILFKLLKLFGFLIISTLIGKLFYSLIF